MSGLSGVIMIEVRCIRFETHVSTSRTNTPQSFSLVCCGLFCEGQQGETGHHVSECVSWNSGQQVTLLAPIWPLQNLFCSSVLLIFVVYYYSTAVKSAFSYLVKRQGPTTFKSSLLLLLCFCHQVFQDVLLEATHTEEKHHFTNFNEQWLLQ